jgi:alpha-galactosidase
MNFQINCQSIIFSSSLPGGIWEIHPARRPFPWLRSAPVSLIWHDHQNRKVWLAEGDPSTITESQDFQTSLGSNHLIAMEWDEKQGLLHKRLEYALSKDHPILQWRFLITNRTGRAIHLDRITMLHTGTIGPRLVRTSEPFTGLLQPQEDRALGLGFEGDHPEYAFYTNGWQSWNYAGTLDFHDPFPWSLFGPFDRPMRINPGTPKPKRRGHFISDFFAIFGDRKHRTGLILGFLSQRQAFGMIEGWVDPAHPTLRMWAHLDGVCIEAGQSFATDWAYLELADLKSHDPFARYFEGVAIQNGVRVLHEAPIGWCSWYHAFETVSEEWMLDNISWASSNRERIPLKIIQLDDGYEREVGDWSAWNDSFPDGIEPICRAIRKANFMPGIWIAPFIAKRRSNIARDKPEWILRNRYRLPVNPGFLWDSFPFVLDITHPGVIEQLHSLIEKFVHQLGFEYLKLDFLYAGALPGAHYDPSLTRAQALYRALHEIRETAGQNSELLGCGCPLGSGIGIFDMMRIGPDVAPQWKPSYRGIEAFFETDTGIPSTRNAILTTINRLPMHQRWWINDPDCMISRSGDSHLSGSEVQTLASVIAMSGGSLILSDHLPSLTEERIDWFARLIPPLPHAAIAVDWFDTSRPSKLLMNLEDVAGDWMLIALINWADHPSDLIFSPQDFNLEISSNYHVVDFWNEHYYRSSQAEFSFENIPPHGICMLSIRECLSGPQWIGDTLHISQGLIVKDWQVQSDHLIAQLDPGREARGKAWIALDHSPRESILGNQAISYEEIKPGIFQFILHIDEMTFLRISW